MIYNTLHNHVFKLVIAVLGELFVAIALKIFVVPMNLYAGYITGLCQLINTLLNNFGILQEETDIFSFLYFGANAPLLLLGFIGVDRKVTIKTIACTIAYSLFYNMIPTPLEPIVNDYWTACLLGGVLTGIGYGTILTCGASGGGLDILGLYLNGRGIHISLGKICLLFNIALYTVCFFLFNIEIVIYSLIFNFFAATVQDRVHQQSVNVQAFIFTRRDAEAIGKFIMEKLHRGVTYIDGTGGYTGVHIKIICVYLSKYEVEELLHVVHSMDPEAFFTVQEGTRIYGKFEKRLT